MAAEVPLEKQGAPAPPWGSPAQSSSAKRRRPHKNWLRKSGGIPAVWVRRKALEPQTHLLQALALGSGSARDVRGRPESRGSGAKAGWTAATVLLHSLQVEATFPGMRPPPAWPTLSPRWPGEICSFHPGGSLDPVSPNSQTPRWKSGGNFGDYSATSPAPHSRQESLQQPSTSLGLQTSGDTQWWATSPGPHCRAS